MKKYLLPEQGQFYKVNLHCHSTFSDGKRTPEELKEEYMAQGYSAIAFTDHNVFIPHNELTDERFVALNGMELDVKEIGEQTPFNKCCHICYVALSPDTEKTVCWHREKFVGKSSQAHRHLVKFDESLPDYERVYTPDCISDMMEKGREGGFFVTYNHPVWSMEDYGDYIHYHGMHAFEILNYGCEIEGYPEYNPKIYDEFLRSGNRIYCVATDDNHNIRPKDHPQYDCFGGWVCVKADSLTYKNLTDGLMQGNFYASRGPEIKELWYEDGKVHITCSPAAKIETYYGIRRGRVCMAEPGQTVCEAEFEVPENCVYFRLCVTDVHGKTADTNAYFLDEL
ncbi:MAG: PHP domain-containing protein [Clostridia bacterium]|nr:PHP domain-containing protein [Clostridia bacterium]